MQDVEPDYVWADKGRVHVSPTATRDDSSKASILTFNGDTNTAYTYEYEMMTATHYIKDADGNVKYVMTDEMLRTAATWVIEVIKAVGVAITEIVGAFQSAGITYQQTTNAYKAKNFRSQTVQEAIEWRDTLERIDTWIARNRTGIGMQEIQDKYEEVRGLEDGS